MKIRQFMVAKILRFVQVSDKEHNIPDQEFIHTGLMLKGPDKLLIQFIGGKFIPVTNMLQEICRHLTA